MPNPIRLILALHNHQPIGNFEHVFQQAYEDSYLPFLDVFSRYESLRIALHTSGSLMEWLDAAIPSMSIAWPNWPPRAASRSSAGLLRADPGDDPQP